MHQSRKTDVVVIGGGLAGLTLALQLTQKRPDLDITIVERNQFPIPEKIAKVGESTVELGSHYLKETLGLARHFRERHLRKHGLRCFFGSPQQDFSQQDELGVSQLFGIPTYQIDRGAIENQLQRQLTGLGVDIIDGVSVKSIDASGPTKKVAITSGNSNAETSRTIESRWIIDAAGRQNFLKSHLDLAQKTGHKGNAVWFRIDRQVKLDEWSTDSSWQARITEPETRWLSTNHLMGPGYWVWVIPLDNGATSFGIVGDDQVFEENDFSTFESTFSWLAKSHPRCAAAIEGADILDFISVRDYAHGCRQVFSDEGWGISGEAGLFADPFYSPGTDFIALGNSFLAELVSDACSGKDIRLSSRVYEQLYQSFFSSTLSLYQGEYGGFGDRRMMSLKLVWDYSYYWGVLTLLFFREAITNISLMREVAAPLKSVMQANSNVQRAFRQQAGHRRVLSTQGIFMNQYDVPCLKHFNAVLNGASNNFQQDLLDNIDMLERLSVHIVQLLTAESTLPFTQDERDLLGDYRHVVLA